MTMTTTFVSCVAERERAGAARGDQLSRTVEPFGLEALWRVYLACRRGKRQPRDTQRYESSVLDHLVSTRDALASLRWRPSRTLAFVVDQPKRREIHAATFADRVVHHLLVERLARLCEPVFIHDSYANRRGKGTHAAVARLHAFMRSATQGGRLPAYIFMPGWPRSSAPMSAPTPCGCRQRHARGCAPRSPAFWDIAAMPAPRGCGAAR
ncbi:hypothetical protein [Thiobaca trueperi]|uniref:Reverse transcriptase (RNA-dependent DNA polymerase) n=1 Tax=Thiobaca trueperi TaxID=127458 RepID=A0A4R3MUN6_9GAMM|nr:hypothetical protein [Thiobaca trueperi]TCT19845.1 hypothetical protein EDC35_107173 [Thiobaca trueperi]